MGDGCAEFIMAMGVSAKRSLSKAGYKTATGFITYWHFPAAKGGGAVGLDGLLVPVGRPFGGLPGGLGLSRQGAKTPKRRRFGCVSSQVHTRRHGGGAPF
jgi:hypothetical protein